MRVGLGQLLGPVLLSNGLSSVPCCKEHKLTSAWLLAVAQVSYVNVDTVDAVVVSGLESEYASRYHTRVLE